MGLLESPLLYDFIQKLAGADKTRSRVSPWFSQLSNQSVLDVGAGTGAYAQLVPRSAAYVGVDFDIGKLHRLRDTFPGRTVVQGDATRLPIGNKAVDSGIAIALAHHLDDPGFAAMVSELSRVIRRRLIFLDPVWNPSSIRGRALWSIDRGAFPRTPDQLLEGISARFSIDHSQRYSIHHHYLFCVATPKP